MVPRSNAGGLVGLAVACLAVPMFCLAEPTGAASKDTTANVVAGVKPFPRDSDAGSMALHALESSLEAYAFYPGYARVAGLSRAGFKFVYDTTEAYEPLRDLYPVDALRLAAGALGFPDAHWETGKSIAEVKRIVKAEIDQGRPVVAPFLKNDAYHGFFVIAGYDYAAGTLLLQGAFEGDGSYVGIPVPSAWSGPTAGPGGWATNPVFVIGERAELKSEDLYGWAIDLIADAIGLFEGGSLAYGKHEGEAPYLGAGHAREALYGLPAYGLLAYDVEHTNLVLVDGETRRVNFGFLWRIDAQVGQLVHDRHYGATALGYLGPTMSGDESVLLRELTAVLERTAAEARSLRRLFWDEIPRDVKSADGAVAYVDTSGSMVFRVADEALVRDLEGRGIDVYEMPWGRVVVDDRPEKRISARLLVRSLRARERISMNLMREMGEYLGSQNRPASSMPADADKPRLRNRR